MTNFTLFTDLELHEKTLESASREKLATLDLLQHLAEIDSRMIYAKRGYSSLWEYVHQALGYSESQASERVSAMRLMQKIPEIKSAIERGSLTLTSTHKLATFLRREKPTHEKTAELIQECEGKSTRQVEKILLSQAERPEALPFSPLAEKIKPIQVKEDAVILSQIQFTADPELMNLLEEAKRLNFVKAEIGAELQSVIKTALKEYIQKRSPKVKTPAQSSQADQSSTGSTSVRAPEVAARPETLTRFIPSEIKTKIRLRSKDQCEYVDPLTKKRCAQRSGLEFDHIHPFAKGGASTFENLRHYCRTHNRLHAVHTYGKEKIQVYQQ